jgi:hypothetical protein
MAFLVKHHLSQEEIESEYTHYAYLFCIVPIYFNVHNNAVCVRNWWPEWLLDLFQAMFDCYCIAATTINPEIDPMFPIKVIKPIKECTHEID